jgi:hypothetical protein
LKQGNYLERATSKLAALFYFNMPNTTTFVQVNKPITFELTASEDGEVLAFKGAILCRAETNLNRDDIDPMGIKDLAKTLVGRAVDVEHNTNENCGVFTAARAVEGDTALSVDGFIWADRYPQEANGVRSGTHALSVEATADQAECSMCNKVFESADVYCEHLNQRSIYGAVRKLRGLHGKGGAVTTNPAGTNTNFNPTQVYFVASHQEGKPQEASMKKDKTEEVKPVEVVAEVVEAEATLPVEESVTPPVVAAVPPADIPEDEDTETEGSVDPLKAQVEEMSSCMQSLQATVKTLEAEVATLKAEQAVQKVSARRSALKASMTDQDFDKEKDTLMGMDDKAFNLFVASKQSNRLTLAAGVRLPESVAGGKEPLTLK